MRKPMAIVTTMIRTCHRVMGCSMASMTTDGLIDEGTDVFDDDRDGFSEIEEIVTRNALIRPGAEEVCDDVDNDCDMLIDGDDPDTDKDDDTFSFCDDDCDDEDPDIHPEAVEVCDDIDNDCDEDIDADDADTDWDEDGVSTCDTGRDTVATIYPGAIEICDAFDVDEDCDGEINEPGAEGSSTFYADLDSDTFGNPLIRQSHARFRRRCFEQPGL